jgi:hypothetical protein
MHALHAACPSHLLGELPPKTKCRHELPRSTAAHLRTSKMTTWRPEVPTTRRCPACEAVYALPGSGTLATSECPGHAGGSAVSHYHNAVCHITVQPPCGDCAC